ncbi:MAG: ABC transporter ATP-binding protein [Myxococcales bacterium]|nr:ABC transporter ATP-binding protein [Myxococcales bacterium]
MLLASLCTVGYALFVGAAMTAFAGQAAWEAGLASRLARLPALRMWLSHHHPLWVLAWALMFLTLMRGAAALGQQRSSAVLTERVIYRCRQTLFRHMLALRAQVLARQHPGDLAMRLTADIAQLRYMLGISMASLLRDVLTSLALGALLVHLDLFLASVVLSAALVVSLLVPCFSSAMAKLHRENRATEGALSVTVTESASMVAELRSYHASRKEERRFLQQAHALHNNHLRIVRSRTALAFTVELVCAGAVALAMIIATRHGIASNSPAGLAAFFAAALLVYRPLLRLGASMQHAHAGLAALERLGDLLSLSAEPSIAEETPHASADDMPDLSLLDVSAGYGNRPVIWDMRLHIGPGECVAVVGASGSGKTTLMNVLVGNLEHNRGSMLWQGQQYGAFSPDQWRSKFAWLPQTPRLIDGSIAENIALGDPELDMDRLAQVAKFSRIDAFVEQLPDGLQTRIGANGIRLSVGETQRVAIARALYKQAPMMVLDEPTSALDGPTEHELTEALFGYRRLYPRRSIVLVSHRLSAVRMADRVLVLDGGREIERGRPLELWRTQGAFYRLFCDQLPREFMTATTTP